MTRRALAIAALVLGTLGAGPGAALAHPFLQQAAPTAGVVAPDTPESVSLAISEPGVARGTRISVVGPRGSRVAAGRVRASRDGKVLSVRFVRQLAPAVYRVRWRVLGEDGHVVGGAFSFGVAGRDGSPPPGAERLVGSGGHGGRASPDGVVTVLGRWIGIAAASLLLGGFALTLLLRRRGVDAGASLLEAAPLAWLLVIMAAVEGLLARATTSGGDGMDVALLTASATGRAELLRAAVVALATVALAVARRRRERVFPVAGALVLATYAASGHVLSDSSAPAVVGQLAHVLAAGMWLGGVLGLLLLRARDGVALRDGARAFAPLAGGAVVLAGVTGLFAAVREVDAWYFLRWSGYGQVVIVKVALVVSVAASGAYAALRGPRSSLLRAEAVGLLGVLALATAMSSLAQGRGQPLPAQRGALFTGPALATAIGDGGGAHVTLAPARRGPNTLVVGFDPESRAARSVSVRLSSAARTVRVALRRTPGGWAAPVALPSDGVWYGYVSVDGAPAGAPVALTVGVPRAPGSPPDEVLAVADLTGADAARCRAHLIGLEMAVGRINGAGGLGAAGHKLALRALDAGADPAGVTRRALAARRPVAMVGSCGARASQAVETAARAGVPVVSGDPTVVPGGAAGEFRLARDPYAEGLAFAQLVRERVVPTAPVGVDTVRVGVAADAYGERLERGLRDGLHGGAEGGRSSGEVRVVPLARPIARELDRHRTLALVVDRGADATRLAEFGRTSPDLPPAVAFLSGRALSEGYVRSAGSLGRLGVIQGVTEVAPTTRDGILYRRAVPLLFPGELPSLDGLRGYVSGLALADAARNGTRSKAVRARLRSPRVFTDALLAPWDPGKPGLGSPSVLPLQPQFLSPTLVPSWAGGERPTASWFPDGTWSVTSSRPLGAR